MRILYLQGHRQPDCKKTVKNQTIRHVKEYVEYVNGVCFIFAGMRLFK